PPVQVDWVKHLADPANLVFQGTTSGAAPGTLTSKQHPYTLIDAGTFGGPQSFLDLPAVPLTESGILLGSADTTIADDDFPNFNPFMTSFPNAVLIHPFAWQNGTLTDLGALPGNNSSAVFEVNGNGVGAGISETGGLDPITGWPAIDAVMFEGGQVVDLG